MRKKDEKKKRMRKCFQISNKLYIIKNWGMRIFEKKQKRVEKIS